MIFYQLFLFYCDSGNTKLTFLNYSLISKFSFHRSDPTVYKHCSVELPNVYKSVELRVHVYNLMKPMTTGQLISSRKPEAKEVRSQRWWTQRLQQCVQCTRTNNVKQWADRQKQKRNIECVGERRVASWEPFKQDEWLSRVRAGHMSTVSPRIKKHDNYKLVHS